MPIEAHPALLSSEEESKETVLVRLTNPLWKGEPIMFRMQTCVAREQQARGERQRQQEGVK